MSSAARASLQPTQMLRTQPLTCKLGNCGEACTCMQPPQPLQGGSVPRASLPATSWPASSCWFQASHERSIIKVLLRQLPEQAEPAQLHLPR